MGLEGHQVLTVLLQIFQASAIYRCSEQGTTSVITVNLTCDLFLDIYVDGRLVGRGNNFSVADNYVIDSGSEVIALKCQGRLPPWEGGILGSFSSGLVTDSSWKCTAQYELGWNMKSYNDEQWPNAVSYKKNLPMSLPWGQRDNVLSNAQWIWTQDNENDTTIYCRHELVNRCMKVQSSFFHTEVQHAGRSLNGFVLKTTRAADEVECSLKCGQLKECVSFNVQYTGDNTSKSCELNWKTRKVAKLEERKGYQYYEVVKVIY